MLEGLRKLLTLGRKVTKKPEEEEVSKDPEGEEISEDLKEKEEEWPTEVQIFDLEEIMKKRAWGLNMEIHGDWPKIWLYSWGYIPERGDLILIPMKSGKKVVSRITKVEWYENVDDMAKINVELLGYKEDVDLSRYKEKRLKIQGLIQL